MTSVDKDNLMRCRLVIVLSGDLITQVGDKLSGLLSSACTAGDVASIILAQNQLEETEFSSAVEPLIQIAQDHDVAVVLNGEPRIASRLGADGVQFGPDLDTLRDAIERLTPKLMVGVGNVRSRHTALVLGEQQPDYIMFGKPGSDIRPEPHSRNLGLGEWWSSMIEIPAIVMGGTELRSVIDVAKCGVEFVGMGNAIFAPDESGKEADEAMVASRVQSINEILDEHAPIFEEPED